MCTTSLKRFAVSNASVTVPPAYSGPGMSIVVEWHSYKVCIVCVCVVFEEKQRPIFHVVQIDSITICVSVWQSSEKRKHGPHTHRM